MTGKICVTGNSHVAAFKDSWPSPEAKKLGLYADFSGCLKDGMHSFSVLEGGKLGPADPEAAQFFREASTTEDFIVAGDYDAFVLVGMRFFPRSLFQNYMRFAFPGGRNHEVASQYISSEALEAALWDELDAGMMLHVARVIRENTIAPVFIAWQPFLSETLMEIEWQRNLYESVISNGDAKLIRALMERMEERIAQEGFTVLQQPKKTIVKTVMTAAKWSRGSRQFRVGEGVQHADRDIFHMNAAFGTACWEDWLKNTALGQVGAS